MFGSNEETFHLTRGWADWTQRDATEQLIVFAREQETTARRRVITWQVREFVGEVLKAEAYAEAGFVLFEERARLVDVARSCGLRDS